MGPGCQESKLGNIDEAKVTCKNKALYCGEIEQNKLHNGLKREKPFWTQWKVDMETGNLLESSFQNHIKTSVETGPRSMTVQ